MFNTLFFLEFLSVFYRGVVVGVGDWGWVVFLLRDWLIPLFLFVCM